MSRTVFVNPEMFENPRRKRGRRKKRRYGKRRSYKRRSRGRKGQSYKGTVYLRRNAGIAPFVQSNPLILSNPRRRRPRRRNPLALPSLSGTLNALLTGGGAAGIALAVNMLGTSHIANPWMRRGAQAGATVLGGSFLSGQSAALGAAFTGAMMMPLIQDLASDLLGIGVGAGSVAAKEADLDALAADLEDVLDDMSDEGIDLSDDDEEWE